MSRLELLEDEYLICRSGKHRCIFLLPFFWLFIFLVTPIAKLPLLPPLAIAFFFTAAAIKYWSSFYVLTSKRLILKENIFKVRRLELFLQHIEIVTMKQSLFGRMFSYGALIIVNLRGERMIFKRISRIRELYRSTMTQIAKN